VRHLAVARVLAPAALTAAAADPVFDSTRWIADLDQVRSAFLTKYANLEWAEAAARMLTSTRLRSESMGFVHGEHWAHTFADDETKVRQFAGQASGKDRVLLLSLVDQLEGKRKEAPIPCDSAPLLKGQRPKCQWLRSGFYGSGLLPSANPAELRGKSIAPGTLGRADFSGRVNPVTRTTDAVDTHRGRRS